MLVQRPVDPGGEVRQRLAGVLAPVARKHVVVEHVHGDAGEAPAFGGKTGKCGLHDRVRIAAGIDAPVHADLDRHLRREPPHRTFHEVTQEGTDQGEVALIGQQEVGKEVHRSGVGDRECGNRGSRRHRAPRRDSCIPFPASRGLT